MTETEIKAKDINFSAIEKKWQKKWEEKKVFRAKEKPGRKKFYVLEMFPYPSGEGLHIGHAFNYIIGDIYTRFKIMQGFNVLHPMGYDSLGLPAENAAIKVGIHPRDYTEKAVVNYVRQQKELGLSYDWKRIVKTHDPNYYKWDQWIFLKMFEKGLAYRKKAPVNWCPKCSTVLANEQVHSGKCWRHEDSDVEIKHLEQWFFRITDYAEELYNKIDTLNNWPERIKAMQKNWIGRSEGTEIGFEINGESWPIFTTRPDTIYGVTFMVVSAQHPRLMELVAPDYKHEIKEFLEKIKSTSEKDMEELNKEGAFTGSYAINPVTGDKIPIWAGNFVIADYGCGMVMAVPAHDQRDFEFAKKYNIPIKLVIQPDAFELNSERMSRAYTASGRLVNSEEFSGINNLDAIGLITDHLQKCGVGRKTLNYKLRDWLVSRQRYWGTPIPVMYCDSCGIVAVPEKDLPVKLPKSVRFGKGNPLETANSWIKTKCPKCGNIARRETDTMDTFVNSSWYFLRFCDATNKKEIFDEKKVNYWMPIDRYIGGAEHACMHLIYFRFYTKFLRDIGVLKFDEPTYFLFNQGMVHGSDGVVMSKSRGNVVLPEDISEKYGIDVARLFLMSIASPDKDIQWSDAGVEGSLKFIKRLVLSISEFKFGKSSKRIESKINKTIKEVTEDIEEFKYNLAIIKIRQLFEVIEQEKEVSKKHLEFFLKLLSPFCPHIAEELWEKVGNKHFISIEKWPVCNEKKINLKLEQAEKTVEKTVEDIFNILRIIKEKQGKDIEKVYIYVIPNELGNYNVGFLTKRLGKKVEVYAVNNNEKYDPKGLAGKAKPGRPGIYVE